MHLEHCTVAILRPSPLSLPLSERQETAVDGLPLQLSSCHTASLPLEGRDGETWDIFALNGVSQIKLTRTFCATLVKSLSNTLLLVVNYR